MMNKKIAVALLTMSLSAGMCLAEKPTFPHKEGKKSAVIEGQYIIQFDSEEDFEANKNSLDNDDKANVVMYIDTRKIAVLKFDTKVEADSWRTETQGIKYFEPGKISSSIYSSGMIFSTFQTINILCHRFCYLFFPSHRYYDVPRPNLSKSNKSSFS